MKIKMFVLVATLFASQLLFAAPPEPKAEDFTDGKPTVTVEPAPSEEPPGTPVSEVITEPESEDEEIIRLLEEL